MKDLTELKIICESCAGHCNVMKCSSDLVLRCPMQKIAVWPSDNPFLSAAVLSLVSGKYESVFCRGCIFVDFSLRNIRLFTTQTWLDYLKKSELMIILVCDRHLEQLASYWQLKDMSITNVIYSGASIKEIKKSVNESYFGIRGGAGKGTGGKKYLRPLNEQEVIFLDLLLKGIGFKEIAKQMGLEDKKIYNLKGSIMRKMHINQNLLITS